MTARYQRMTDPMSRVPMIRLVTDEAVDLFERFGAGGAYARAETLSNLHSDPDAREFYGRVSRILGGEADGEC